jgi:hypothetical protein
VKRRLLIVPRWVIEVGLPLGLAASLWSAAPSGQAVTLDVLMPRAAEYAAQFVDRFAHVVTEEHYVQTMSPGYPARRDLRSDLVFVRTGGPLTWTTCRDVFEVDGKPVRDHQERLTKLFLQPLPDAMAQARRISDESARYNLGPSDRTTNTPELPLLFLQASVQPRFSFSLGRRDVSVGEQIWTVRYQERARPTVISGDGNESLFASGRFWIDATTGMVVRAETELRPRWGTWEQTTEFTLDERSGIAVPTR